MSHLELEGLILTPHLLDLEMLLLQARDQVALLVLDVDLECEDRVI